MSYLNLQTRDNCIRNLQQQLKEAQETITATQQVSTFPHWLRNNYLLIEI